MSQPEPTSPPSHPWRSPDFLPPAPEPGWGFWSSGQYFPCTLERLREILATDPDFQPPFVWTPQAQRLQPAIAVPELFDLLRARQMTALDEALRSRATPALTVGVLLGVLSRFVHGPIEWLVVLWFAFFGMPVLELALTRWQWRRHTAADGPQLAESALFHQWLSWQKMSVGPKVAIGVLAALFLLSETAGFERSVRTFAMSHEEVRAGEWWRLLTSFFLHGGIIHLIFNCGALSRLAQFTEALTQRAWVWICLLVATLGGSLLGVVVQPAIPSVGASGGILGLLGFLLVHASVRRHGIPAEFRSQLWRWVLYLALLGLIGRHAIDNAGHVGGLLGGALCGVVANASPRWTGIGRRNPGVAVVGGGCAAVLAAVAVWMAVPLVKKSQFFKSAPAAPAARR